MTPQNPYDTVTSISEFYDSTPLYAERRDIEFYVAEGHAAGGPVLELACGTGRVLLPTARAGVEITGLDSSERMLAQCRARLASEPEEVRRRAVVVPGDLASFEL